MKVLVLRPAGQTDQLAADLAGAGLEPVIVPAIEILPAEDLGALDNAIARAAGFDWVVFTSVNGVSAWLERGGRNRTAKKVGAVGPVTEQALRENGIEVDWVPSRYTTEALAGELPGPRSRVLLVRAEGAGTDLEDVLRARGFDVERVNAYRTEPAGAREIEQALAGGVDAIVFTSASIVDSFVRAAGAGSRGAVVACIGPATARACRLAGLPVDVEAKEHTSPALAEALIRRLTNAHASPKMSGS